MADNIHGFLKLRYSEKAIKFRKKSPKFLDITKVRTLWEGHKNSKKIFNLVMTRKVQVF